MGMSVSKVQEIVKDREAWYWYAAVHGIAKSCTWLSNYTTTARVEYFYSTLSLKTWPKQLPKWYRCAFPPAMDERFSCPYPDRCWSSSVFLMLAVLLGIYHLGLQNHCRWWLQTWNKKTLVPWKKSYDQPRQLIKKQRRCFANKDLSSQTCGFSSTHVWMRELDYKESWLPKNWCFWTVVLEKTLESPLDCNEIQSVHRKGNHSWIFIGRTDADAETSILWPPDVKNWLKGKDPDSGKDWTQEKETTEDETAGRDHWLNGHESE